MKRLLIPALCVLALAACTGKQNKNGDAAKNADTESVAGNVGTESAGSVVSLPFLGSMLIMILVSTIRKKYRWYLLKENVAYR